ncbi:MAG: hypothetical protein Hals2KO_32370 [Halioglobus sp.]
MIFSPGSGGSFTNYNWFIEELLGAGYAVATLDHPGNSARNNTTEGIVRVWDRPGDISLVLDSLQKHRAWSERIDFDRVGVAGHSSGGYTAIALAGALYDFEAMAAYCSGVDRGPDCDLVYSTAEIDYSDAGSSNKDDRFKSVFAMAPAVGPGVTTSSLEAIDIPVYIISTEDDELLGLEHHAYHYANHIPDAQLELIPSGGHFLFVECSLVTRIANWFIEEFDLCGSQFNIDRDSARQDIARQAVIFFDRTIGEYRSNNTSKGDVQMGGSS